MEQKGDHTMANFKELFIDELKDLYDAEHRISEALPKMRKAADSTDLADAFGKHIGETKHQIERLDKISKLLETDLGGETCEATKGLIEEGEEKIEEFDQGPVRDSALIAAAQRVEHYEIAAYGTVRDMAKELGLKEIASILQETLDEEGKTDEALTKLAVSKINPAAARGSNGATSKSALKDKTKEELYEMAQDKDIEGRSDMSKQELVAALS
jgi:ferritin-like metal-binding protein YciE